MSRHRGTPLRRIINPPIDPWSTLIDGPWTELIEGSLYETLQQSTGEDMSENAEPSPEDGYEVDAAGTYTGENE